MPRIPAPQRREHLIDATLTLATREGFNETSVRRIAEEANVSLGVVHYCFRSKDELMLAMTERIMPERFMALSPAHTTDDDAGHEADHQVSLLDGWLATWREQVRMHAERVLLGIEVSSWSARGDRQAAKSLLNGYHKVVQEAVDTLPGIDEVSEQTRTQMSRMLLAAVQGATLAWLVDRNDEAFADVLSRLTALVVGFAPEMTSAAGQHGGRARETVRL